MRTLISLLFFVSAASAATLRVPDDYATIQAAVDAAGVDAEILIAAVPGSDYSEAVIVAHKVNLTLTGVGMPELSGEATQVPLTIRSSVGIVISGLRFGNGNPANLKIEGCVNVTVTNCEIDNCPLGHGISVDGGVTLTITRNSVGNCGLGGLDLSGDIATTMPTNLVTITRNTFYNNYGSIDAHGNDYLIEKNTITDDTENAIEVDFDGGSDWIIQKNTISGSLKGPAISIRGDGHTVLSNRITDCRDGITARGTGHLIEKNRISGECTLGIQVWTPSDGIVVRGNKVVVTMGEGLGNNGGTNTFEKNSVTATTGGAGIGLRHFGGTLHAIGNKVKGFGSSGARLEAGGATLTKNKFSKCSTGIRVDTGGNEFIGNSAKGNRNLDLDDAVGGVGNTYTGNKFGTTNLP